MRQTGGCRDCLAMVVLLEISLIGYAYAEHYSLGSTGKTVHVEETACVKMQRLEKALCSQLSLIEPLPIPMTPCLALSP